MCGRYYIEVDNMEIIKMVQEAQRRLKNPALSLRIGEIYPTNIVPVLNMQRESFPMKWGFKRFDGDGVIINARSETAAQKNMFHKPLHEGRCLIPASGYFEWQQRPDGKKQKYAFSAGSPLYMAGLYRTEKEGEVPTFVILTREATPDLSIIHNRMPVVLPYAQQLKWLDGDFEAISVVEQGLEFKLA